MNHKDILITKLNKFKDKDIIITNHAQEQAIFRGIEFSEVKENIINPQRLSFAGELNARNKGEAKYDCYFGYSKTRCHRYILVINSKCIICTIIKIRRRWQRMVEKYAEL